MRLSILATFEQAPVETFMSEVVYEAVVIGCVVISKLYAFSIQEVKIVAESWPSVVLR